MNRTHGVVQSVDQKRYGLPDTDGCDDPLELFLLEIHGTYDKMIHRVGIQSSGHRKNEQEGVATQLKRYLHFRAPTKLASYPFSV